MKHGNTFLDKYAIEARVAMQKTGIVASVTLAQAFIESGQGKSKLTREALNFFGIKGKGPLGSVNMRTREVNSHGQSFFVVAPFRKYATAGQSFIDHGLFFIQNKRYKKAVACGHNAACFAHEIAVAGYATDPHYEHIIMGVVNQWELTTLDK
jgi:flagellum-specific peptidoglycan hydrolase FlgJ